MKRPLERVEVFGAAKINIGWRVGSRREDGYHNVSGHLQTISLTDRVEITTRSSDVFTVTVPGHPDLENDMNLVHRAAEALTEGAVPPPTTVVVHKAIPVAAGLGGGSADAAAALVGLNAAWGTGLSARELVQIGAEIGSDVPAILMGGLVHASGRGEIVRNVGSFDAGSLVLGVGAERLSTPDVYAAVRSSAAGHSVQHNDLEAAACELVPALRDRIDAMREAAGVAFLSGSGPTVVGAVADEATATRVADRVHDRFADVQIAQPIPWGVRLRLGA